MFPFRPEFFHLLSMLLTVAILPMVLRAGPPSFEELPGDRLAFRHVSPISPERHIHLYMGSGLGWDDFDRDGELDLLICQGAPAESMQRAGTTPALTFWRGSNSAFDDRSRAAGLEGDAYGMGLTIADYDGDGFADVFTTGLFAAALYRNNGDGTFADVTEAAGIRPSGFGAGCCWTDLNADGHLDLFYVRYVHLTRDAYRLCTTPFDGGRVTIACNPTNMPGDPDSLYINRGDGAFEDVSQVSGMKSFPARQGLGCSALDLDDNGTQEVYVANDTSPNDLWTVAPPLKLEEIGLLAGVAVNAIGVAEAGMGIAAGDVDGDLRPELFVTNYFNETNTLYRNEGQLVFLDVTENLGLAGPSRQRLGFGVTLADLDNDGWSDFVVANGHVHDHLIEIKHRPAPFAQRSQVMHNQAGRRFEDVSDSAGTFFTTPYVSRGTAAADYDRDGRVDVAVLRLNDRAALLHNATGKSGSWLGVELRGTQSNRDGVGATVIVYAGKRAWRRDRMSSSSYLCCDSPQLHFGLGAAAAADRITVRWPGGRQEEFPGASAGTVVRLVEGTGRPSTEAAK